MALFTTEEAACSSRPIAEIREDNEAYICEDGRPSSEPAEIAVRTEEAELSAAKEICDGLESSVFRLSAASRLGRIETTELSPDITLAKTASGAVASVESAKFD